MPEELYETTPMGVMPAAVMMWAGFATMLFYTTATMIAYAYTRD
jgi:hypothetical protein